MEELYEKLEENVNTEKELLQYIKGRIDADGHVDKKKKRIRICYTTFTEAKRDALLFYNFTGKLSPIKFYKKANEYILEICGKDWKPLIEKLTN